MITTDEPLRLLEGSLTAFILILVVLLVVVAVQPRVAQQRGGKILIFFILCAMPLLALVGGTSTHLEISKTTSFCMSCHVMEPYGQTLWLDDSEGFIPASHFQNNRVDREQACYACHTTYTMFGDVQDKLRGFKHLMINYLGTIPDEIELYDPYANRECLHCHENGRNFEATHEDFREELLTGDTSCLDCHDMAHPVKEVEELKMWEGAGS